MVLRGCPGQWEWMHFLFIYVHVYAFIPWLCSVKRHLSWQTSTLCSALLISDLHIHSCLTLPPVEILVVDCLVVVFHGSPKFLNNFKCSRSVEKLYIILTASDFSWRNTCTKDGSFSRQRIESACKIDPGADRISCETGVIGVTPLINDSSVTHS